MKKASKAAKIRELGAAGWDRIAIAKHLRCHIDYVHVQLWCAQHPHYKADWMRRKREQDLDFRERERRWQLRYNLERMRERTEEQPA